MKKHSKRYLVLMKRVPNEDDLIFTDEEKIFLCKEDWVGFADKYPRIAKYYMETLSDLIIEKR